MEQHVQAHALAEFDTFELAGEMYRVEVVRKDSFHNRTIIATPVNGDPVLRIEITCAHDTPFKIYTRQ